MKKLIVVLVFLAVISPVFAQNNPDSTKKENPNVYYISVTVEKIWLAGTGYVVQYRKSTSDMGTVGIPYNWFTSPDSKAELVNIPKGPNWPYMTIFYRDGKFSHIRLYPHWQKSHQTWGVTPQGADVSRHFQEYDSFKFDF
jgi:hypothetical protein